MTHETEQELIARAKTGDQRAFADLWGRYQEAIKGYIAARIDDGIEVDALVNEVALAAWQKIGSYSERWKFYTFTRYWAGIIVLRYCRRHARWTSLHMLRGDLTEGSWQWQDGVHGLEDWVAQDNQGRGLASQDHASLLRTALTAGGKPHQIVCFAYCKLIKRWGPQRIVRELSDMRLCEIERHLEEDYLRESELPASVVAECFSPLRQAVTGPIGMMCLRDWYGADPEDNVSDWAYKVRNKTLRAVEREKSAPGANVECDADEQAD